MSGVKKAALPPLKVLIVEDNMVNQKVTSAMLKHLGIESDIAQNGQVAMEMVRDQKYDIVFMDCQMPVMNGFDATRQIRQLTDGTTTNDVPILAMTANAAPEDMRKCYDAGMNDIIAKPVELETLSEILHQWIRLPDAVSAAGTATETARNDFSMLENVFDVDVVKELQSLMGEDYKTVFEAFINSLRQHMPALQTAVAEADATTIAEISHTLKGSSANVGANGLSELCKQLMEKARSGDLSQAEELLEQVTREFHKVDEALKPLL